MSDFTESLEQLIENNFDKLNKLEIWIAAQKHIPKNIPRIVLIQYIKFCDYDLEETKKLIDGNVKFRIKNKYLFTNRDIDSEDFRKLITSIHFARFPKLSKEGYAIESARVVNQNASNFNMKDALKLAIISHDTHALIGSNNKGIIQIYDASEFTFKHFIKVVSNIQAAIHYTQYGSGLTYVQPKQVHFLSCSTFISKIISMLKPFFSKEIMESIHCHSSSFETLHKFIDKECLPIEFGGNNGTLEEHMKNTLWNLQNNRDYINNDENFFLLDK
ncbi:hypothetical protein ACKWTF_008920 [Chironomus riparius]